MKIISTALNRSGDSTRFTAQITVECKDLDSARGFIDGMYTLVDSGQPATIIQTTTVETKAPPLEKTEKKPPRAKKSDEKKAPEPDTTDIEKAVQEALERAESSRSNGNGSSEEEESDEDEEPGVASEAVPPEVQTMLTFVEVVKYLWGKGVKDRKDLMAKLMAWKDAPALKRVGPDSFAQRLDLTLQVLR